MMIQDDVWFEVWFTESSNETPVWLLVVKPDENDRTKIIVCDPQENYRVIHRSDSYEQTCIWLGEDEFEQVEGRMFQNFDWDVLKSGRD